MCCYKWLVLSRYDSSDPRRADEAVWTEEKRKAFRGSKPDNLRAVLFVAIGLILIGVV
jgi:hypothetical protein